MAANNFNIKYNAMDQLYISAGKRISEWNKELDSWSKSYNQVVGMETFQGVSATGAKTYLAEVHGVLLYAIQQAFASYMSRLLLYKQGYHDIDSSLYASLPEEKMKDLSNRLSNEASELDGISRDVNSSLNSISDIIYLSNPSKDYLQSNLEGLKKDIDSFSDRISNYESSQYNSANGDLKSLIDALERTVKECYNSGANIASYTSGSIARSSNIVDLFNSVDKENKYIKENAESIKIAGDKQTADFKQMQADYEAACKAREEQGIEKMIIGGIAIAVGTFAIVATAGAATPLVVTAVAYGAGGCSIAYGLSNGAEGGQDLYYGSIGDLSSTSFNPIRDTIFCGNQKAYDTWGNISMTVSSLVVPVGKVLTTGGKMAAANVCAKELGKATAVGFTSGKITEYASDKLHLNGVESLLLNLGLNVGLYKATNFAGGKLAGLKSKPFAKGMDAADAERYNKYWDDLAAGKDMSHPGMSDVEYQKWMMGDLKVQEQLALNKINPEEIIALRMKEIQGQNKFLYRDVEAERLNQHWSDLETGKDLSHPGMSDVEYQKWMNGDLKLQDQLALNKVNSEEINALRMKEIWKQNEFLNGTKGTSTFNPELQKYVRDSFEGVGWEAQNNFNNYLRENVWCDETLSNAEKINIMKANFDKLTPEQKENFNVLNNVRVLKSPDYSNWGKWPDVDWPDFPGLAKETAKSVYNMKTGEIEIPEELDRLGSPYGNNLGVVENGHHCTQNERSICYIENENARNCYKFDKTYYKDAIDAIKDFDINNLEKSVNKINSIIDIINEKQGFSNPHITEVEISKWYAAYTQFQKNPKLIELCKEQGIDSTYGVMGKAEKWIVNGEKITDGGAGQINTPINVKILEQIGIVKNIGGW